MKPSIRIGDNVRIQPYYNENLYGESYKGLDCDRLAQVAGFEPAYHGQLTPSNLRVRVLHEKDNQGIYYTIVKSTDVVLEEQGNGTHEPGVTCPFSPQELQHQRFEAFDEKVKAYDWTHQGFSNAATFLAHLYLNQTEKSQKEIHAIRRKDGTVNADKVKKIFHKHKYEVDSWALEIPFGIPKEIYHYHWKWRPKVNWDEVAEQFKGDPK